MLSYNKKRTHSISKDEVPVKVTKSENEDDNMRNENSEDGDNEDNHQELVEEDVHFAKDFKMMHFRRKLKTNNFITELRHFLHLAEKRPKIISKYIEKKGKPLELVEAMERIDKNNIFYTSYILQALQMVLMEILTKEKTHTESAIYASRYFLKCHSQVIEKLINSPNIEHRKCVLKLLTAIVCLEPQMGRQILTTFDGISNVKAIKELLSHSKREIGEPESVRKVYIHFILSYLIDGNLTLIRNILDKYNLMNALLSGLAFDDHVTVCVVMNTLKKYVLMNPAVSKTKKAHVFDIDNVTHIIKLYTWKGPTYYAKAFNRKITRMELENTVDPEGKHAVAEAAHDFLVTLLSSRKYGIAFDALSHKIKHNITQKKVLINFDAPWLSEHKMDLVMKILIACPELVRGTIRRYGEFLNINNNRPYFEAIAKFLERLINELKPSILGRFIDTITLTEYSLWIKEVCLCTETLMNIKANQVLKNDDFSVRICIIKLLYSMYNQYCNFIHTIMKREHLKGNTDLRKFKFDILNHIFVNFPTVESILLSFFRTMKLADQDSCNILKHLEITLDLLLLIAKNDRTFIDKTGAVVDYLSLLKPVCEANFDDNEYIVKLELKAVQVILLIYPQALNPEQKNFMTIITSFINAFVNGTKDNQKESGNLLKSLFINAGLFENATLEIDIWLEALKYVNNDTRELIKDIFINIFDNHANNKSTTTVIPAAIDDGSDYKLENNIIKLFNNIEMDTGVQDFIETINLSKMLPLILSNDIDDNIKNYLEIVSIILFHYLPSPSVIKKLYSQHFTDYYKYMITWLDKTKPGKLNCDVIPKFNDLYKTILIGEQNFYDLFKVIDEKNSIKFIIDNKDVYLDDILDNERLILIYIYEIIFIISQLTKNSNFEELHTKSCTHYLSNFLQILHYIKLEDDKNLTLTISTVNNNDDNNNTPSYLEQILKYIFCNHLLLQQNFNIFGTDKSDQNFITLIDNIITCVNNKFNLANIHDYTIHYRSRIVLQISNAIQETIKTGLKPDSNNIIKILENFRMSTDNCFNILQSLSLLSYTSFYIDTSTKSIYFDILVYILNRLSELKNFKTNSDIMTKTFKIYTKLVKNSIDLNLEKLEEAFYNFLQISHQTISQITEKDFIIALDNRKINKYTVKLLTLLLERHDDFDNIFIQQLPNHITKKELIYPLLNVAFTKHININIIALTKIYQEYKSGFMKTIEKPQKAGVIYKDNITTSLYLIDKCMPISECIDFSKKNLKVDSVEVFQLKIIEGIYKKAIESDNIDEDTFKFVFVNFLNTIIQLTSLIFKKDRLEHKKFSTLSFMAYNWVTNYSKTIETGYNFEKIIKTQSWQSFCKACLKQGMQSIENEEQTTEENSDHNNSNYLKTLAYFCDLFYANSSDSPDPALIFEMATSHSCFFDITFNQNPTQVKTQLMYLLLVLIHKNKTVLDKKHIPVLLGAYQAKLSSCDQYILAMLQYYEQNDISLYEYRPFIWGDSAISHYSLKDNEEKTTLNQEPSVLQVMSLVDKQISEYTIKNFPIWRKLNALKQIPEVQFENPDSNLVKFGFNKLEREIESGTDIFDDKYLRLCPKKDDTYEECYDPAFIIPLMSMSFAPGIYTQPVRPVQNGLLAIVFAAFSSQDKEMRLAAGCVQLRYRQHFENNKFFDKLVWIQAYDNIQNGLENLQSDWLKHKRNGIPRVPYISGLFLSRTINVLVDPMNSLYKVLALYLRVKNSFNFLCVPEFNVLFHSPEIDHQTFRNFITEVIRDGIKCSSDLLLLVTTSTFKAIMGFYGSTMSNLEINLLILSVISVCCKIPASSKLMIDYIGIIPWLNSIIDNVEYYHFDTIEGLITTINNLWYASKAKETDFHNYDHIQSNILHLLVKLSIHMSGRISLKNYTKFLNILCKTVGDNHKVLPEKNLDMLISCGQRHFPDHVWCIENIKTNGANGVESREAICKRLKESGLDDVYILGFLSLREFVVNWVRKC